MTTFAFLDAEEWNRPNIYFSLASLLAPCGSWIGFATADPQNLADHFV
jgi:hypothetical protein